MGAFCNLLLIFFLLVYSYAKLLVLFQFKDIDIIEVNKDYYYSDNDEFTAKSEGFFLAAALTNYDTNQTLTESPEYGELLIEHYGWGN